jgi:hypothetical protein
MFDLISNLSGKPLEGTMLVLAIIILALIQYFLNRNQTKTIGSNHLHHFKEELKEAIDAHEQREHIFNQQLTGSLQRIETILTRIDTKLDKRK